jgi:hypothetical protein
MTDIYFNKSIKIKNIEILYLLFKKQSFLFKNLSAQTKVFSNFYQMVESDESLQNNEKCSRPKSPVVFCIHGNKWGIANCCEELEDHQHSEGQNDPMVTFHSHFYDNEMVIMFLGGEQNRRKVW